MTDFKTPARPSLLAELGLVIACLVLTKLLFDQIVWRFAGPISLGFTLSLIAYITLTRAEPWTRFGLVPLRGLKSVLLFLPQVLLGILAIGATAAIVNLTGEALGWWVIEVERSEAEDRFAGIVGNWQVYLVWIAIAVFSAGLGEEVFFRGYLMRRVEDIFSPSALTTVLMIVLPAAMFGVVHFYYQGIRGAVSITVIGMVIGTLYLLYKRNLWPLITAHALIDIIGLTARFLDADV